MIRGAISALLLIPCAVCSLDAVAKDAEVDRWITRLPRSGKCSEAAAQLARLGRDGLPHLEMLADGADPALLDTIAAIISTGLLKSMQIDALEGHEKLLELVEGRVRAGFTIAVRLTAAEKYDSGEVGLLPPEAEPPELSPPRKAVRALLSLRGFAVPAAQALARDPSPASKKYAADVLVKLIATSQRELLLELGRNRGQITISHGCYGETITVGDSVSRELRDSSPFVYWFRTENRVIANPEAQEYVSELCDELDPDSYTGHFPVTNALRQEARTAEATSWDEYWERAGPVIGDIYRRTREH